jgi:hypothetical protein
MIHVFGHHHQVVCQGCGSDENVCVTNELTLLVEQRIQIGSLDNDVIGQRQHQAVLTALLKTSDLSGRTTGFETP